MLESDCLGAGLYCEFGTDGVGNGQDLLYEVLRQVCVFRTDPDRWEHYLVTTHTHH